MIQVDIGGHPPFPTGSKQFSGNFGNLLFLAGFKFHGHFKGPNEIEVLNDILRHYWAQKMNLLDNSFPMSYHTPKTKIVCKSYDLEKLMYSLTQTGPTWLLVLHLLGLGFWMSRTFGIPIYCKKRPFEPHCNHLLANASNRHISSQR